MNEIRSEILKFLEYSTLLSESNKRMVISEIMDSDDENFLDWVLLKLKNENDHITNFLKWLIVNIKDWVSIQDIKQEMTRTFLQDMKIKEIQSNKEYQKDIDLILTEMV